MRFVGFFENRNHLVDDLVDDLVDVYKMNALFPFDNLSRFC